MMSIVSSRVVEDYFNGQGQRILRLGYTDSTGKEHILRRNPVSDIDANTFLINHQSEVQDMLSRIEIRSARHRIMHGEDPRTIYNDSSNASKEEIKAAIIEGIAILETDAAENQPIIDTKSTVEAFK